MLREQDRVRFASHVVAEANQGGSMVASVFMHLSNERKWIYGALILTVIGFAILMTVPSVGMSWLLWMAIDDVIAWN